MKYCQVARISAWTLGIDVWLFLSLDQKSGLQTVLVKFYWNIATPIHIHTVLGYFHQQDGVAATETVQLNTEY